MVDTLKTCQVVSEVLIQGDPKLSANQVVVEAVVQGNPKLAANQVVVEVIEQATPTTATPEFNPSEGGYLYGTTVAITCETVGSTIYYTTDGSTPSASSTQYTSEITLTADVTIKAIAITTGYYDSSVAAATYELISKLDANLPCLEMTGQFGSQVSANLPTLEIAGQFGSAINATLPTLDLELTIVEFGIHANLPTLSIEANSGSQINATLPALKLEATGYMLTALNANLPTLSIEATGYQIPALYTDPRPGRNPKLPELRVEMSGTCPGKIEGLLPCLEMTARVGARGEMKLPALSMEARISTGGHGSINASLPPLEIVGARAGSRFKTLKLPALRIEATGSAGLGENGGLSINAKLPALQITAISFTNPMVIDAKLPALDIVMTGSRKIVGQIEAMLPGLKISAHAELMVVGELSAILPDLRMVASGHCQTMIIDATLPALIMTKFASGDDYGGGGSVMTNPNRFSTDLLRYERWPA